MLVRLARDWFDGQTLRRAGIPFEYYGEKDGLPSKAVVLSADGNLPDLANTPKAGFGAKPVEEQLLDMAGAGPTHQIELGGGAPSDSLTPQEQREKEREATETRKKERDASDPDAEAQLKADKENLDKVLPVIEKAAEDQKKANDPLASLSLGTKAETKTK